MSSDRERLEAALMRAATDDQGQARTDQRVMAAEIERLRAENSDLRHNLSFARENAEYHQERHGEVGVENMVLRDMLGDVLRFRLVGHGSEAMTDRIRALFGTKQAE